MMKRLFVILIVSVAVFAAPVFAQQRQAQQRTPRTASQAASQRAVPRAVPRTQATPAPRQNQPSPSYRYDGYGYSRYYRYYGGGYYGLGLGYSYSRGYGYGYGGYGYGYGGYMPTGLKFDLELVRPQDREVVKNGIITVDGAEFDIVNRHDGFWNGTLSVPPGDHEVIVELSDGRRFQTQVVVYPGSVRRVYIRFEPPSSP